MEHDYIAKAVVDSAFKVHNQLGPGLLEHVYEVTLAHELSKRGFKVERQVPIPIVYDGIRFNEAYKADLIVNKSLIVELKSVKDLTDVHKKQLLTYLKLAKIRLGLLINFNESLIKNGIKRLIINL
ncbi:MAG: GxxExxY protein [Lentisphaeraceae bacterium]|nr:GxxExxY protein [Lentisphaeraceae bacterium]